MTSLDPVLAIDEHPSAAGTRGTLFVIVLALLELRL